MLSRHAEEWNSPGAIEAHDGSNVLAQFSCGQQEAGHRLFQDIPCVDTMNDSDDEEAKHDTLPAAAPPPENPTGGSNQEPSAEEAGTKKKKRRLTRHTLIKVLSLSRLGIHYHLYSNRSTRIDGAMKRSQQIEVGSGSNSR